MSVGAESACAWHDGLSTCILQTNKRPQECYEDPDQIMGRIFADARRALEFETNHLTRQRGWDWVSSIESIVYDA